MPRKSGLKRKRIEAGHSSSQKANVQNLPITPRRKKRFGSKNGHRRNVRFTPRKQRLVERAWKVTALDVDRVRKTTGYVFAD